MVCISSLLLLEFGFLYTFSKGTVVFWFWCVSVDIGVYFPCTQQSSAVQAKKTFGCAQTLDPTTKVGLINMNIYNPLCKSILTFSFENQNLWFSSIL